MWTFRMASRAARSLSTSRRFSSKGLSLQWNSSSTRSTGAETPEKRYIRFHFSKSLPQKLHSSGVLRATRNQWWQTRRMPYEPFRTLRGRLPLDSGMMCKRKMCPRISGGMRATFNKEFRERLSRASSAITSLIRLSRAMRESMLISQPMLVLDPR